MVQEYEALKSYKSSTMSVPRNHAVENGIIPQTLKIYTSKTEKTLSENGKHGPECRQLGHWGSHFECGEFFSEKSRVE